MAQIVHRNDRGGIAGLLAVYALVLCPSASASSEVNEWVSRQPPAKGYTLDVVALEPLAGTPLVHGRPVTITMTINYVLEVAPKGNIVLVFQDERNRRLIPDRPQNRQEVPIGTGTLTLTDTVVVPSKTQRVQLFVLLVPEGQKSVSPAIILRWPTVKSPDPGTNGEPPN